MGRRSGAGHVQASDEAVNARDLPAGYGHDEVGVVPADWTSMTVGEIAPLQRGFDLPTTEVRTGPYPVVYSNGILRHHNRAMARAPGVVTGRSGTIGKVHFVAEDYWPHNTALWVVSFLGNDPKFVYYLYDHLDLARFLSGSGVPTLNRNDVHDHYTPLPPLPEQRAIATVLSDVDELMGSLEALITKKRAIKQAAMQDLLAGRKRLPGFAGEWEDVTLGEIGKIYGGLSGKTSADFGQGHARYVSFLDVLEQVTLAWRRFDRVRVGCSESQNRVMSGDVLFNATSETPEDLAMGSMVAVESERLYLNSFCCGFRIADLDRCDPLFLAYLSRSTSGRKAMYALAQGATRYNLSKKLFLRIQLLLPSLREQQAIATVLSDMDAEITALEHRLDKTRAIKQGVMQQLLTGSIRLPIPDDDAEDEDAHAA